MSKNDGGPAFPTFSAISHCDEGGMTLRDYFAAKAMAAMIGTTKTPALFGLGGAESYCASAAYTMADAMIAERSK
jgi:hypothetical protein